MQRERDRIPKRTRQTIGGICLLSQGWTLKWWNCDTRRWIYSSVQLDLQITSAKEVNYWLTKFILEARRVDGNPYPARIHYIIFQLGCWDISEMNGKGLIWISWERASLISHRLRTLWIQEWKKRQVHDICLVMVAFQHTSDGLSC